MEDFSNNAVRDIMVQRAAQSAKTQTVMNCSCWVIAEDPGCAVWGTATRSRDRRSSWGAFWNGFGRTRTAGSCGARNFELPPG